jgi:hypothetical protein
MVEVNSPLATLPPQSPDLRVLDPSGSRPGTVHDLRGHAIDELRYPTTAALVVAGVPGAGKSTALRLFFGAAADAENPPNGPAGSVVLDSLHSRNRWRHRLGWLPYPLWRPVVHIAHFATIRTALREGVGPVVIHDCATRWWARRMIAHWAAKYDRELHMILIDVPASAARAGQYERGRRINGVMFMVHCFRWRRLLNGLGAGRGPRPAPASMVIIDRVNVGRMGRISFAT